MLDLTKPVQTRDGRAARIIATDRESAYYPVVALVERKGISQKETLATLTIDGREVKGVSGPNDLINIPEKHVRWVNLYPDSNTSRDHQSRKSADDRAGPRRIACLKLEFTEGEGL